MSRLDRENHLPLNMVPIPSFLPDSTSQNDTMNNSELSKVMLDKIQGLSIQMGELYAQLYRDKGVDIETVDYALEAYKNTRRMLPTTYNREGEVRHIGHGEAFESTSGTTLDHSRKNPSSGVLPDDSHMVASLISMGR
jgi:hypothetical protein